MRPGAPKLFWTVPLLTAALVSLVGWWADHKVNRAIQKTLKEQLETVLEANVAALEIWIRNQERMAEAIASEPQMREISLALLKQVGTDKPDARTLAQLSQHSKFDYALNERLPGTGYLTAFLVTTNRVIAGTVGRGRMRLGTAIDEAHEARFNELFASGKAIIITPFKPSPPRVFPAGRASNRREGPRGGVEPGRRGPPVQSGTNPAMARPRRGAGFLPRRDESLMQVAAPVKEKTGALMGALAFILRPEDEFTRVLSVARSGLSGETFAFDQNGLMISQSRFDDQLKKLGLLNDATNSNSALSLELRDPGGDLTQGFKPSSGDTNYPLARMIADAVEGGAGVDVNPQRDYRGVPVVGAWRWLPQYGFGVATKIDAAEAYQPLKVLRLTFIVLVLLLALCTVGVLLFSYSNLVWRRKFNEAQLEAIRLGQYTLQEKIGEGGMGTVYKAQHALLRRETAIKLLLPEKADDYTLGQFEREVQLTCRLTHPNTIQVYDYGHTPEGIFYYAMEFLRGLTLSDLVKQHGGQPEERVLHILAQVCESLKEAHAAGLIHRDIKPGNIFLCERGGVPDTVKVLDFGLVKHLRDTETWQPDKTGFPLLVGTPQYMPPETIQNPSHIDVRGDIYAVGAVGYFLLVGKNAFDGDSAPEIFQKHLSEAPVPPSQRSPNAISTELENLILRCLEKDPKHRPQTATELLSLFRACSPAATWTLDQRTAWWNAHVDHAAGAWSPAEKKLPSDVDRTVRIDFEERRS